MSNLAWGTKRICQSCQIKYYDLSRTPIICPKCQTEFDPGKVLKARGGAPMKPTGRAKSVFDQLTPLGMVADNAEEVEEGDLVEEEDDGDDVVEDSSDLGDDEDDIAEVATHTDEE